jgi:hypothetical protein
MSVVGSVGIASPNSFKPCGIPFFHHFIEDAELSTATVAEEKRKRGRPATVHANTLKPYLQGFSAPGFALASLPSFDSIVTGAVNLDMDGNTRPLSKKLVVSLLQRLDVISAEGVREYMHLTSRQCSERHAQKIALCLRVIERAAATAAATKWPAPPAYEIEPCGREGCSVCSRSQTGDAELADVDFAVETDNWADSD